MGFTLTKPDALISSSVRGDQYGSTTRPILGKATVLARAKDEHHSHAGQLWIDDPVCRITSLERAILRL